MTNLSNLFYNPVNYYSYGEPTREELAEASYMLDAEYRGNGINIDSQNIDSKVRNVLSKERLKAYALFVNIVQHIIDVENPHYIRVPHRFFRNKKGDPPGDKVQERIDEIYKETRFNSQMLQLSRQGAYEGTVMIRPTVDEAEGIIKLNKLTPSDKDLKVIPDPSFPSEAFSISYKTDEDIIIWDKFTETIKFKGAVNKSGGVSVVAHKYYENKPEAGGIPYAILRYVEDSSRFWGPYDGGLQSLVRTRSLLLSDTIHRTQTSLYELLIMAGFTPEEALAATRTKASAGLVAYELDKDAEGKADPHSKDIRYVSPEGISPEKVFEAWTKIYKFFLNARGHTGREMESTRLVPTAEAQRLASVALKDKQEAKKPYLVKFEEDLWHRFKWINNNFVLGAKKIPDDITISVDWQPDERYFNSASDKVDYYDYFMKKNLMTGPDIIRAENPELTQDEAEERFKENIEFNKEHNLTAEDIIPTNKDGDKDPAKKGQDGE